MGKTYSLLARSEIIILLLFLLTNPNTNPNPNPSIADLTANPGGITAALDLVSTVQGDLRERYSGYEEYNETDLYVSKAALNEYGVRLATYKQERLASEHGNRLVEQLEKLAEETTQKRRRKN